MAPTNREGSNPRLLNFSMVVDERLEELLIITIFAPVLARFFTVKQEQGYRNKHRRIAN